MWHTLDEAHAYGTKKPKDENQKIIEEPELRAVQPLTVFELIGAVRPLRIDHAVCPECQNLAPVSFVCNLPDQGAHTAIHEWVKREYGDKASLVSTALSMKVTVQAGESQELSFTLTTRGLSGVRTIVSMQLHAGNPRSIHDLKGSLEQYLRNN